MMRVVRRLRSFIADSGRWEGFRFREDDIVISTPPKSGTTWMQTIVAMLVFGRAELPAPMGLLSPWLDMNTRSVDDVFAMLDAQTHRRFIKTHSPQDVVPWDDRVTYLTVVRHPLQVARSMDDHLANLDMDRALEVRAAAVGNDDLAELPPPSARSDDPRERLLQWIDDDFDWNSPAAASSLRGVVEHAASWWSLRDRPNVHLFHYSQLRDDLDGQMRRVAAALGIDPGAEGWNDLVAAASFDSMKANADLLAPDSQLGTWRSTSDFFRMGGQRSIDDLTPDDLAHFEARLRSLAGDDLADWMLHAVR